MAVKFQSFDTSTGKWTAHQSKGDTAKKAAEAGRPVRVVHPVKPGNTTASWFVTKNKEALPETMATRFVGS